MKLGLLIDLHRNGQKLNSGLEIVSQLGNDNTSLFPEVQRDLPINKRNQKERLPAYRTSFVTSNT